MTVAQKSKVRASSNNSVVRQPLPTELQQAIERTQKLAQKAPPITTNPERMGGTPVIGIQRLPVKTLLDHLIGGATVNEFAAEFECDAAQVRAALQRIRDAFEDGLLTEVVAERVDY